MAKQIVLTDTPKEFLYEHFVALFEPITNHIERNASFDGSMFETYAEELEYVRNQNPNNIWTVMDGDDGNLYVTNGYWFVNRIGYFITKKQWIGERGSEEYLIG